MMNEAMTGSDMDDNFFTSFTFKFLEGTGWYLANFQEAQRLYWGKGAGCEFVELGCKSNDPKVRANFCYEIEESGCTFDKLSYGSCFYDPLSDGCGYILGSLPFCTTLDPEEEEEDDPNSGEYFSSTSKCFESSVVRETFTNDIDLRCHNYECIDEGMKIFYTPDDYVTCSLNDQGLHLPVTNGFQGKIKCPSDYSIYCGGHYKYCIDLNYCNGNGICLFNKCQCNDGYQGKDCSERNSKRKYGDI